MIGSYAPEIGHFFLWLALGVAALLTVLPMAGSLPVGRPGAGRLRPHRIVPTSGVRKDEHEASALRDPIEPASRYRRCTLAWGRLPRRLWRRRGAGQDHQRRREDSARRRRCRGGAARRDGRHDRLRSELAGAGNRADRSRSTRRCRRPCRRGRRRDEASSRWKLRRPADGPRRPCRRVCGQGAAAARRPRRG